MFDHRGLRALSLTCFAILLAGCGSAGLTSIQVAPATQVLSAVGENAQFSAIGTYHQGSHPATTRNITNLVTWSSSDPGVATINSAGLATALASGTTTISASMEGFTGLEVGAATVTVTTGTVGGPTGTSLSSLAIIPGAQIVDSVNETGQFIAMGTFVGNGATTVEDVTNLVTWSSSDVKVATIDASGLATGLNVGTSTITAIAKSPNGSLTPATATFTENSLAGNGTQLATLTIYKVGNNASIGTVASPDTAPPLVINCGTGAGCVGNFPIGTQVILTAAPGSGSTFGGWSANCAVDPSTPNQCAVTMSGNDTVGAIFN